MAGENSFVTKNMKKTKEVENMGFWDTLGSVVEKGVEKLEEYRIVIRRFG